MSFFFRPLENLFEQCIKYDNNCYKSKVQLSCMLFTRFNLIGLCYTILLQKKLSEKNKYQPIILNK